MIDRQASDIQNRKADSLIRLLEQMIRDVQDGRLYGEFAVRFTAQGGNIGHYEEDRRVTYK